MEVSRDGLHTEQQGGAVADAALRAACGDALLAACDATFARCYDALHAREGRAKCRPRRLQSFITRYRPLPGEASLPKHVDGISLDGSLVVGLPTSRPFEGGGLTVWEGHPDEPVASHFFPMRAGDACFLDRLVWHQANPVTSGERWAIVIFYKAK